jgi:hypothetical protein
METTTENLNTTITTPLGDHIAWNIKEGHTVSVYEYKDYVSVETTMSFDKRWTDIEIFYRSNGKKITRESTMKNILHSLIREG